MNITPQIHKSAYLVMLDEIAAQKDSVGDEVVSGTATVQAKIYDELRRCGTTVALENYILGAISTFPLNFSGPYHSTQTLIDRERTTPKPTDRGAVEKHIAGATTYGKLSHAELGKPGASVLLLSMAAYFNSACQQLGLGDKAFKLPQLTAEAVR